MRPFDPRAPLPTPPAPVFTGREAYDVPMPVRPARRNGPRSRARRAIAAFAVVVGLWLLALAASQATSETVAVPFLGRTVSVLGGVPALLQLREQQVREAASKPGADIRTAVPGFPVQGVTLPRDLAQTGSLDDWHVSLMRDAGAAAYERGPAVFTRDGVATSAGLFSTSQWVRTVMSLESSSTHFVAWAIAWGLGVTSMALAGLVFLSTDGARRFVAIGLGLIGGALIAALGGLLGLLLSWVLGIGDDSPFVSEVGALIATVAWTPLHDAGWAAAAGFAIAAPAAITAALLARIEDRETRAQA